jgi:gas vesicle protein
MHRDEDTGRFVRDQQDQRRRRQSNRQRERGGSDSNGVPLKTTLGLLAGAGIGAGLMYLFDPYEGPTRRARLAETAGNTWDTISERAGEAGSAIASHLPNMPTAADARDTGRKYLSRASDSAQETAGGWLESARNALPSMPSLPQRRRPTDVSGTGAALGGLGLIALTAAATWLLDPQRGRGRRAWLAQKATRYMNETGQFMRATGRHLRNRAQGAYHEGRSAVENMTGAGGDSQQQPAQSADSTRSCPESITGPTSI